MAKFQGKAPDKIVAELYTRDYTASSVLDDINHGDLDSFSETSEYINYYEGGGWKVYKITVTIEPAQP